MSNKLFAIPDMGVNSTQGTYCCPICMKHTPHSHSRDRWIGVDFDGTVAYSIPHRTDPYILGEPIANMINRIKDWIAKGYTVKLLTARMNETSSTGCNRDVNLMRSMLQDWCIQHIGIPLECTNMKDGWMEVLWDDKAVGVIPDMGIPCEIFKQ